jgi:hypothetical protein
MPTPVIDRKITDTEALIDHLKPLVDRRMANEISQSYFGDIGVYLPSAFQGPRKDNRAVLAFAPAFDRFTGQRVANQETRLIGVDIIGLVNITPYFSASPEEAYGERQLAALMRKIRDFLTLQDNVQLDGRVREFSVNDITWAWLQRKDLSLRAASIEVTATVTVSRKRTT